MKKYYINNLGITPHLLVRDRVNYSSSNRKGEGFTVIELLVSATILIVIFSFVLANFRAGQYSGELDVITRQIIDGVSTVRNMALGGQLIVDPVTSNRVYPDGGYGISFNRTNLNQFVLFADFDASGTYNAGAEEIPNGIVQFSNVDIIDLCVSSAITVTDLPCQTSDWVSIASNRLDITFPRPGVVIASDGTDLLSIAFPNIRFVGGVLEHQKTEQQSYFYVSLFSGLITGDEL